MGRTVSKLIDLDIDEVSLVDRAANQHSLVAFSKSLHEGADHHPEESMSVDVAVFSETGEELDVDALEHGDTVYLSDGTEYVFVEDDGDDDDDEIGKAGMFDAARAGLRGQAGPWSAGANSRANAAGRWARRNKKGLAVGGGIAGAGAIGAGAAAYSKSLSDEILEDFSKAVTDRDREFVIAKAMEQVEIAQEEARIAKQWAEDEHDARMTEAFISKAEEYNLPVAAEVFGPILKSLAEVLTDEQLDVLDEVFNAVSDTLYNEIGYVGGGANSSVFDQVDALANEYVGKSDYSKEQAVTAMFEANPAAYDAYMSEMGR